MIALFYYANVARQMWMNPVPDEDRTPIRVPAPLATVDRRCAAIVVVALGIYPQIFARLGDLARLTH